MRPTRTVAAHGSTGRITRVPPPRCLRASLSPRPPRPRPSTGTRLRRSGRPHLRPLGWVSRCPARTTRPRSSRGHGRGAGRDRDRGVSRRPGPVRDVDRGEHPSVLHRTVDGQGAGVIVVTRLGGPPGVTEGLSLRDLSRAAFALRGEQVAGQSAWDCLPFLAEEVGEVVKALRTNNVPNLSD